MGFANTRAALAVYDAGQAERDAAWEKATTEQELADCMIDDIFEEEKVQDAYFLDTGAINTIEHCRLVKIDDKLRALVSEASLVLSCGHTIPTPKPAECGAVGYATVDGGARICYGCMNARHRDTMTRATKFTAYLHGANGTITDWPGLKLGQVEGRITKTVRRMPGNGAKFEIWTFRARDLDGGLWACRGTGLGMAVQMRRMKGAGK